MSESPVISTQGLTKRYKDVTAVQGLNMTVRPGEIYGFLGLNGAGKTTTMRMLLGLIRPTSGTATILGEAPGAQASLGGLGALIETPGFYPYLSATENLEVFRRYSGAPKQRIREVLEQVGLSSRGQSKVKGFSTGMKQRLGLAVALLKSPQLLMLDEPTNGLDPQGTAEIRSLIKELGNAGHTILFSSHQLTEVEQVCNRVGVISAGREGLIAEGTVEDLRGKAGILVRAEPVETALRILKQLPDGPEVNQEADGLHVAIDPSRVADVTRSLIEANVTVNEVRPLERSLEDVFLSLTQNEAKKEGTQ